jgi:isopenicillin N synthase-like dioxygenase
LPIAQEPGLQIRTPTEEWLTVPYVDGGIIVNTGEYLNRWTNGRFLATPHRVFPPKNPHYSIAFFFNPTWDTVSTPLPRCVSADNPARFEPTGFLDYMCWSVERNFSSENGGLRSNDDTLRATWA